MGIVDFIVLFSLVISGSLLIGGMLKSSVSVLFAGVLLGCGTRIYLGQGLDSVISDAIFSIVAAALISLLGLLVKTK